MSHYEQNADPLYSRHPIILLLEGWHTLPVTVYPELQVVQVVAVEHYAQLLMLAEQAVHTPESK
jgi:hypothetical protein